MEITTIRNLVIRYGAKLGMKSNQQVCLWHLLDHDFTGKGYVFPSEAKIAERMGLESDRQVRRIIDELESKKYIMVKRTQGFSNRYSFKGITKAVLPFWQEEIKKERERLKKNTPDKNVLSEHNNPGQKCPQPRTKMSAPPGQKCPPKHCNRSTASKHSINPASKNDADILPKDSGPSKQPSEWQVLFGTYAEICGVDIGIAKNAARLGKELRHLMESKMKPTRELLLEHYAEPNGKAGWNWYKQGNEGDWRGQRGNKPTPAQVVETWGNWKIVNGKSANQIVENLAERSTMELGIK